MAEFWIIAGVNDARVLDCPLALAAVASIPEHAAVMLAAARPWRARARIKR
jgi:hypothetical protein